MNARITGIGIVSPYGVGRERLWEQALAGVCALRPISRFDASTYRNTLGGEVPDFDIGEEQRACAYVLAAAEEAAADAGVDFENRRVGIVLGTNFSGMAAAEGFLAGEETDLSRYSGNYVIRRLRERYPSSGPEAILSLSCASGNAAVATGLEWLREGRADLVLAGGYDELSETAVAGLSALRAITQDTVRPWDAERGGTIFSEGAGVFVLEPADGADERGYDGYVRVLGRGVNNDAFHMTAPDKTGAGIIRAMEMALHDAGAAPEEIAHLNLHGTGTRYNDMIETAAVRGVFGDHVETMSFIANKSLFGHAMGAAGALETAICALTVQRGIVPPTIGTETPDPELLLNLVFGTSVQQDVPVAMTNSYGLGGTNASLVLARV